MIAALIALQLLTLTALIVLLVRRNTAAPPAEDPRLAQLLASDLPAQFTRLDARSQGLDQHLRAELSQLRTDTANEAQRTREASSTDFGTLRTEIASIITNLGVALNTGLDGFRADNKTSSETLRSAVQRSLDAIDQRLASFTGESSRHQLDAQTALHSKLTELGTAQTAHQEQLRSTVETQLHAINQNNEKKLEEMRVTVDEKLHATLQTRLTESFSQVTDQLTKVHTGLGEMTKLSAGVDDLSRIFTNVKSRGQFAEAMLDNLLKQMLAPSQFVRNIQVRPNSKEVVEFAIRFPGLNGEVLLPVDSKFPRESAERLESAYDSNNSAEISAARKVFENAIRTEAKRISSKYINEPVTTPNAIMFLPTEGLYAEVMRRDGLHDDIQQNHHVMIAGPSNLSAILTSFQMVFALVNLQKKGGEVWNVLASARSEFGKFGGLMDAMDKQVGTVQNTIREIGVRTRAINKTLKDVSRDDSDVVLPSPNPTGFDGLLPALAASDDE
jgi:DNA recombination protein RmuC